MTNTDPKTGKKCETKQEYVARLSGIDRSTLTEKELVLADILERHCSNHPLGDDEACAIGSLLELNPDCSDNGFDYCRAMMALNW